MAIITSTSDLQEIRYLVFQDLKIEDLPDEQIRADIYLGTSERRILTRRGITESQFNALNALEQNKIKTAIKYQTAILLLPGIAQLLRETVVGISYQYQSIDLTDKIKRYEAEIEVNVPRSATTPSNVASGLSFVGKLNTRG